VQPKQQRKYHSVRVATFKNIAVFFGDDTFPKKGRGFSTKKFEDALVKLGSTLSQLQVSHVFLPSYKGTNIVAGLILKDLKIPFTLVIPHPSFGNMSTLRSKLALAFLSKSADRTIVMGEKSDSSDIVYDIEEVTEDFVDYISKHCNSLIVAHKEGKTSKKFTKLLERFPEDAFEKAYKFTY
tara:strand:- start:388 stop:933 length:546 start_codon:yes stop_codon:yes gene_type:complete